MKRTVLSMACAAVLFIPACEDMTREERMVVGGLTGAAVGIITARALEADDDWKIVAALAGAAVGVLVAQNRRTGDCAYSRGDGTYRIARCP
ncbi:glucose-6-phosphate isomerase [Aestuariicoccus sp. MJ-SS9]|uniref:glucose-6-phosphate isomerase n=1 Tax=Aestuariicoccus sp. MJ-SS9 TaxID=3079855 RepID=UPI00290C9A0B|nr:glucose-6-phosphate isomerase [Aestuariicoccus sp. MJ-SS9]MDU8913650.1 glucose-6-phosphate isomerase [Aestuariicoccus sp. MJ-SS9]